MEVYGADNNTENNRPNNETKAGFFAKSEINLETPPWEKICFFLTGFIGLRVVSLILSAIFRPLVSNSVMSSALANALLMLLCYGLTAGGFILFLFFDKRKTYVKVFSGFRDPKTYLFGFAAFAGVLAVNYFFSIIYNLTIPDIYHANANQEGITEQVNNYPFIMFFSVVLFAPFVEELTYRIGIVDTIGSKNKYRWLGIVISSVVFGMIHFDWNSLINYIQLFLLPAGTEVTIAGKVVSIADALSYYKQIVIVEFLNIPVYILPGFIFAFTYAKTGRISTTMFAHMSINFLSFVQMVIQMVIAKANTGMDFTRYFR